MKKTAEGHQTRTGATPTSGDAALPGAGGTSAVDEQSGTRHRVARSILDHGPSTAAELAKRLELTQAAVRRHLDALVGEGVVEPREKRVYGSRGRGRPAKVFALTDCGRDAFDQSYDQLAADALRWIARSAGGGEQGEAAVAAFARARVADQAERYRRALAGVPPAERTRALAAALAADGYAATARSAPAPAGGASGPAPAGEQLCQHHCPVAHTAEEFPQLCEAETEIFSRLLGTHVQRLATIAHGDGVCTTFIPHVAAPDTAAGAARDGAAPAEAAGAARPGARTEDAEAAGPRTGRPAPPADSARTTRKNSTATTAMPAARTGAAAKIAGRNPA